jgi:hypothetical protein
LLGFAVPKSLAKAMLKQQEELGPLVPRRRQQNVDGLAGMIHHTMAIVPLPFHLGGGILLANAWDGSSLAVKARECDRRTRLEMPLRLWGIQPTHESLLDLSVGTRKNSCMCLECRLPKGRMYC